MKTMKYFSFFLVLLRKKVTEKSHKLRYCLQFQMLAVCLGVSVQEKSYRKYSEGWVFFNATLFLVISNTISQYILCYYTLEQAIIPSEL